MSPQNGTHVCFTCRKHRSVPVRQLVFNPELGISVETKDPVPCPQCQRPMLDIGHRLQVPRKDDKNAWDQFWFQYISPGYGAKGLPEIDAENLHFSECTAKKRVPPQEDESTGCARCDKVWQRMPETERQRWWTLNLDVNTRWAGLT